MTQPITYVSRTARFDLPLLFAGQAQKEFTVNDALTRISALLHPAVSGESTVPPSEPEEGENWLVASPATGEWSGQEQSIACRVDGGWLFIQPSTGLRCYDSSSAETLFFDGSWKRPEKPSMTDSGEVQDTEARAAVSQIIQALKQSGIV